MEYYKRVELTEGTPVVFVGVHALRWQQEWGEPRVGFVEADDVDALAAERDSLKFQLQASQDELRGFKRGVTEGAEVLKQELANTRAERDALRRKLDELDEAYGGWKQQSNVLFDENLDLQRKLEVAKKIIRAHYGDNSRLAEMEIDELEAE